MYDRKFFRSKLGHAAILSILAMVAMNVVALGSQLGAVPTAYAAAARQQVELA